MASANYTTGSKEVFDGTIAFLTDTLKVMLVGSGYTFSKDHLVVDAAGANDPVDEEISVTGYTGGWGGAGRKTIGTKTVTAQLAAGSPANSVVFNCANITWTALGAGATIEGAILIKEGGANDTTSRLISYGDVSQATNGGDVTLDYHDTNGIFYITI